MATLVSTNTSEIPKIVDGVRAGFNTHKTVELSYRRQQLENLRRLCEENKKKITDALYEDLHKNETEAEYNLVLKDILLALDNFDSWAWPKEQLKHLCNTFKSVYIQPEPYGVVLIIAPWNYPFQLAMLPLIGAIAAGNACIIRPDKASVATSNLLAELIPKYLDSECYAVITGGPMVSKCVLKERYDYIFFTGSTRVGKIVMKHATEHITPVTLELGGKSPVLVAPDANIPVTARRIVWGKFLKSGQTSFAPDYVLCTKDKKDELIEECKKSLKEFFGKDPKQSDEYGRIINAHHFERLVRLLEATNGNFAHGGKMDGNSLFISPTLISGVISDDILMKEEIFGPILPFVVVKDVDDAIRVINSREKPLAFYVFTESTSTFAKINKLTSARGILHNDTIIHYTVSSLPFGGVGYSGMGAYHGEYSFKTFSHYKPVLATGTNWNSLHYRPFTRAKTNRPVRLPRRSMSPWKLFTLFLLVTMIAILMQMYNSPNLRVLRHAVS